MPVVSVLGSDPFTDGRQSERALAIRTGVERYYHQRNWASLVELTLKSGRRADLVVVSPKAEIIIIEVKSSIADLKADSKWSEYRDFCDFLFFATLADVPQDIFPVDAGLFIADAYDAELLREAPTHRLSAARRKSMLLKFARNASQRLSRLSAFAETNATNSELD